MASPSPSSSSEAGESEINLPAAAVAASKRDDTLKPGEFPHPEVVTFPPQEQNGEAISVAAAILPGSDASKGDETLKPGEFPHPEVVAFPQQEQNGDAVAAAILLHSNASKLAKEIQGKLARGTVGCKICHSVVRRSAPVDASQGKCLDSPYWRCPGCGLVYAAPPTLACLLEDDKMRNSVPELRGAGGLSLRSPLPEDTATTRRYSAAAAASPTVSASKLADDDGLPPSAAAPHLNLVPENGLASQHEDMDAASNPSTHPVPVPVPVVGDSAYAPISNAVEAGGLSPRSNRLVAALAYLERADASTGSSRPRTPPPRPRPRPIQEPVSHVFVCYGRMDTWPCTGPLVPEETVPRLLNQISYQLSKWSNIFL